MKPYIDYFKENKPDIGPRPALLINAGKVKLFKAPVAILEVDKNINRIYRKAVNVKYN